MKKIIKRFWGVALVVVLLSTLLVGTLPQAAAANLSWGYANLPGGTIGPLRATNANSIFAPTYWSGFLPNCVIYDFAVANDGKTIYAATSYGGFKSTDGGRHFSDLFTDDFWSLFGMDPAYLMQQTDRVAVAPDNPNLVVFIDTLNNKFGISNTGGTNLHVADVTDGASVPAVSVTDVDICPKTTIHGQSVNLILVSGTTATGAALFYLNYGVDFSDWDECLTSTAFPTFNDHFTAGATTFVTVKHSPNFIRDYVAYLVGDDGNEPSMDIVSFNSNQFNNGIPSYQYYPAAGVPLDPTYTPGVALDRADIVFDPNFLAGDEESRFTYISVDFATSPYQGGFYRVTDNAGPIVTRNLMANADFSVASSVWSIDINADGSTLVAAAGNGSTTWTITSPKGSSAAIAIVPSRLVKRSGGGYLEGFSSATDDQTIAFASAGVVLSRAGSYSGAFALSRDTGYTFNDISMLNFLATDIDDHVVNATTGVERYVIASGNYTATGNATSVFYWDGTYWERTLTIRRSQGTTYGYLAGASPNNFNVLYLADMRTAMLRYTATNGRTNWLERTCPTPFTSGLADIAVQDDQTIWVATQVSGNGCVTKVTETGNIWPTGPPYFNAVFGTLIPQQIQSITLISANNLVAGGKTGGVAYSMFGGAFWMPLTAAVPGNGAVHATADKLDAGGTIYAVNTGSNDIYTWTIGTSLAWVDQVATTVDATQVPQDLQIYGGAMYYLSTNGTAGAITGATSMIGRAIMPALDLPGLGEWKYAQIQYALTTPATQSVMCWQPDPLKFSVDPAIAGGVEIWITDASGAFLAPAPAPDQIMVFTDSLVTYVPTIASKDGVLVQVNRETGVAYNTTLTWNSLLYKAYEVRVAYDAAFTRIYATKSIAWYDVTGSTYNLVVGPTAPSSGLYIPYQPGETWYWQVRVASPFYSAWSAAFSINVQPIRAPVPELYSPANGGFVPDLRPGFSWSPMGYVNGGKYRIQIATAYTFADASIVVDEIVDASAVDGAGYGLSKDLKDGTQYFWHVQVVEPYEGDWSTVANFRVRIPTDTTPVVITQTNVTLTNTQPQTSVVVTAEHTDNVVNPSYIWAIIIIGSPGHRDHHPDLES